ncbi:MAG: TaqI-like C-terminal specificity domain-containing protein [Chlorobiales bacterium]
MSMPEQLRGKKELGAVYTPKVIIDFMLSRLKCSDSQTLSVLEPACADAPFLSAFQEKFGKQHALVGVEIDTDAMPKPDLENFEFRGEDFLLWKTDRCFDVVLGNPPYGIIGHESHYPISALKAVKAEYRARSSTWRGKYNIYGAFIEQSVKLLKPNGQLCFIVPSTWLVLDDFILLRKFLAEQGELHVHYLGKAFTSVNVVAVVLHFIKNGENQNVPCAAHLYDRETLRVKWENYSGDLITFEDDFTRQFERRNQARLGDLFHIHFAARSPEVKKSAIVFSEKAEDRTPLLTGRNLKPNAIDYETNYTGLYVEQYRAKELRAFYGFPHIVVGHTKGAKVVAAFDERCYAWREEFHLVPKRRISEKAVVAYLNSEQVQRYVATLYRDLTPHLTKTQLARLPIPTDLL